MVNNIIGPVVKAENDYCNFGRPQVFVLFLFFFAKLILSGVIIAPSLSVNEAVGLRDFF